MIKEDYVSFETAKLLKEKGFEEPIGLAYWDDGTEIGLSNPVEQIKHQAHHIVFKPTLQMAMKWLREIYDLHVVTRKDFFNGTYTGRIYDGRRENVFDKEDYIGLVGCETYEKACESAIKYCLENLI